MKRVLSRANPSTVLKSRRVRDYALMTFGILVTAWGLNAFLIPNKLAAGGVSGLATVFYYLFQDKFGVNVPIGMQMLAMNSILLIIGVRMKGWRYGAKTVYGMVAMSLAVDLLAPFTPHLASGDRLLAVLYGGAVTGIGMGLVFKARGNTGGTDIIAQLLVDKVNLGIGQLMLAADAVVTVAAAIVLGPDLALYGAVAVFVMGTVIDVVQEGLSVEKAAFIICDEPGRVADAVLHQLGRGATGLVARGLYSAEPREMVFTVVSRREIDALKALVLAVDPDAFLIIADVREVLGEGFKENGDQS
ncbi:MAG: YitT family protein [Coriobacteriia bacterium]|nr:YitT family protein [Coriobacteriia bacterium]MDZ4166846.1 YitT family protein [Coriobacteriia bacterium]